MWKRYPHVATTVVATAFINLREPWRILRQNIFSLDSFVSHLHLQLPGVNESPKIEMNIENSVTSILLFAPENMYVLLALAYLTFSKPIYISPFSTSKCKSNEVYI